MKDYYKVLDLPNPSTAEQMRVRYKQLIRIYHPDRFSNPIDKAYAEERLKLVNEAYAALTAPNKPSTPPEWDTPPTEQTASTAGNGGSHAAAPHVEAPLAPLWRRVGLPILTYALLISGLAMTPLLTFSPLSINRLWYAEVVGLTQHPVHSASQSTATQRTATADWVPIVSADGRRFAFVLNQAGSEQLYIRDPQSGQLHQVTSDPGHKRAFLWSADGNQLAFIGGLDTQEALYVFNMSTAKLTRVSTAPELHSLSNLRWAPDGHALLGDLQQNQQQTLFQVNLES